MLHQHSITCAALHLAANLLCSHVGASSLLLWVQVSSSPLYNSSLQQKPSLPCRALHAQRFGDNAGRQQMAAFSFSACRGAAASCGVKSEDGLAAFRQVLLVGAASGERGFAQRMLLCLNPGNAGATPGSEVMRCRLEDFLEGALLTTVAVLVPCLGCNLVLCIDAQPDRDRAGWCQPLSSGPCCCLI